MLEEIYEPPPKRTLRVAVAVLVLVALSAILLPRAFAIVSDSEGNTEAKELIPIPVLDGQDENRAVEELTRAGFIAETKRIQNSRVPPGMVFDQDPVGGVMAERNTTVTLIISVGTGFVVMPELKGSLGQDLEDQLARYGLVLGEVTSTKDENVLAGEVIDQSPEPGVEIALGTSVNVVFSQGPGPREVPSTVGMTELEAAQVLISAGFSVEIRSAYSSSVTRGRVISTLPASGSVAEFGSMVTIVTSVGSEPPPTTAADDDDEDDDDDDDDDSRPPASSTTSPRNNTSTTMAR